MNEGYYYELWRQEQLARQMVEQEVAYLRSRIRRMESALSHVELGMVMYEAELAKSISSPQREASPVRG